MISFIIPIYNAEDYLAQCLESILAQRGDHSYEILLIDDESTDNSLAIAQAYAGKDNRILVLTQTHAGQSAARNLGLRHAKGNFIAFVDADDALEPDWSEKHLAAIQGVDYVQSAYLRNNTAVFPKHKYQFTAVWARLYRREAIQTIRFTEGMIYEDVLFSVDLWTSGVRCRQIDYAGYRYTYNPNSTTSRKHTEKEKIVLQRLRERLAGKSLKGKMIIIFTILRLQLYFAQS